MSNDYIQAAEAFKRFRVMYGAMFRGFELLGELGSVEAAIADAQQRLKALQEQIAVAQQEADAAERDRAAKHAALTEVHAAIKKLA
jgi:septal ring factor EnvC (AmiA/AmiB activator)